MCRRNDIYMVNLPNNAGSVQKGKRPFLIIQNDMGNKYSPTVIGVAMTSKVNKKGMPTHVYIGKDEGIPTDSIILCEQVLTIDKSCLLYKVCTASDSIMKQVDKAVKLSIALDEEKPNEEIISCLVTIIKNKQANVNIVTTILKNYCLDYNADYHKYLL